MLNRFVFHLQKPAYFSIFVEVLVQPLILNYYIQFRLHLNLIIKTNSSSIFCLSC